MSDTIVIASTAAEYESFGALIREYWGWLVARYADHPGLMDQIASHQGLEHELNAVPKKYGPPEGKTLLAMRDGQISGGVAYRDLHDGSCEMKRLYVPDRFQGHGTGRLLCEALIAAGSADGFSLMRLDTGYLNTEAMQMYDSMGFRRCPPYQAYPPEVTPHLRFMEIRLPATRTDAL